MMLAILHLLGMYVADLFKSRRRLEVENLFLRHQLNIVLRRTPQRLRLRSGDRALLVWMTRRWPSLLGLARVVQPDTILRWHRAGFRAYWRWKSQGRAGRPRIERELRDLIRRMSKENPLWGAPRIHGELLKLGFEIAESTVSKYMIRRRGPPSQNWRTFLCNHADAIAAIDLCVVPTLTFERLFALLVLGHGRRQLLWFAVTRHPMQRLHEDDLAGVLLRGSEEWTVLSLPAIAEQDEQIPIGNGLIHCRHAGDVLHPEREPRDVLESLRAQLGPETFAAQYQQQPVAPGGAMIKRAWVRRYDQVPKSGLKFQSWDVANKQGEENDYSVCTTWLFHEHKWYLIDVLRGRFDYPTLRTRVSEHAKLHKPALILIEDAGFGTALIQELKTSHFSVIPVKPEYDKKIRMSIQSGKFESSRVFFPKEAPWLADLEEELFAFPSGPHDDQVDSISQALGYRSPSHWTNASLDNYTNLVNALAQDAIFGRLAGRPW